MPEATEFPVPTPHPNSDDQPFWDALTEDRVILPQCRACDHVIWYPRPVCPGCGGSDVEWIDASGDGTVYSFSVTLKAPGRFSEHVPFVVAYVELDEGPRVLTNIVDTDVETVHVGQRVSAVFHAGKEGTAILRFRPAG